MKLKLLLLLLLRSFNVSSSSDGVTSSGVRSKSLGRESTSTLKTWLLEHIKNPYPSKGEKIMLAVMTRMTLTQVSTWFANARRRLKKEYRVRWLDDSDSDDDDDLQADDDDVDERECEDSEQQQPSAHLRTPRHQSVFHQLEASDGTYHCYVISPLVIVNTVLTANWTRASQHT